YAWISLEKRSKVPGDAPVHHLHQMGAVRLEDVDGIARRMGDDHLFPQLVVTGLHDLDLDMRVTFLKHLRDPLVELDKLPTLPDAPLEHNRLLGPNDARPQGPEQREPYCHPQSFPTSPQWRSSFLDFLRLILFCDS